MNVNGRITLFVATKEKEGNKFKTFRGSVSSKNEDGTYESYSLDVIFDKETFPSDKLNKMKDGFSYQLEIEEGWLKVRSYKKEDSNNPNIQRRVPTIAIYVKKGHLDGQPKEVAPKQANDSDLPF